MKVFLVAICLPFSLVGGFWLTWALGYNLSVAVAVGFIALAGVATEFGVVMLLYIDNAVRELRASGASGAERSEEHTSELQSLMRISYAVFCLKKKNKPKKNKHNI